MSPKVALRSVVLAFCTGLMAAPASVSAAVTVMGGGMARICSQAAIEGRTDDLAIETCTLALDQPLSRRDRAGTLVNRGVLRLRRGDFDTSRRDFNAAIRLQPDLGEAFVNRGAALIAETRYREGIADIDKGLTLGPEEPEKAYYNRALAWEGLDDPRAAWFDYQKALELKPDWEAPRHQLTRFTVTRQ